MSSEQDTKYHLEVAKSLGGLEADMKTLHKNNKVIIKHLEKINGRVDKHDKFIQNVKGSVAVMSVIFAALGTIVTSWIKTRIFP